MKGAKSKGAAKADTKLAVKSKGAEKPAAKGKKGKAGKDPNKPKRAPSAFFVFMGEFREEFKQKNPKNKSVAAVGKAAGERWKSLSESEKAPFVAKANKLKGEYNKAIAAYNKGEELSEVPHVYDRLVLMVIDGLPAEFVLGRGGKPPTKEMMESMPYTQSLLAGCRAVGYHAKAAPPTVTMPRLKFLETGPELGNNYSEVIAPQDVAVYGALCALASFDRSELKSKVIDNINFRNFLELVPEVRELVNDFYARQVKVHLEQKIGSSLLCDEALS